MSEDTAVRSDVAVAPGPVGEVGVLLTEAPTLAEGVQVSAPELPAWVKALEDAPIEELRKHPRFSGVLGSELERRSKEIEAKTAERVANDARERAEKELLDLADTDPDAFSARFKQDYQTNRQIQASQRQTAEILNNTLRRVDGFSELNEEDRGVAAAQAQAVQNANGTDDEVLQAWTAAMMNRIQVRRESKIMESRIAAEAEKRASARIAEQSVARLSSDRGPGLERPRGNGTVDASPDYRDAAAYNRWYDKEVLKR